MVKRILKLFNKDFGNVHHAAILLGVAMFMSQILGLVRDRILASSIGPSQTLDIYYAAFRIPDLLFVTIASLASVTAVAPMLAKYFKDGDGEVEKLKARKFLGDCLTFFTLLLIIASVVVFFAMPILSRLIAPGFDAEAQSELVHMSRIMLASPILLGVSNLLGSVTQLFRRFTVYALSPIVYNLGIIVGIVFFYPTLGIVGLAYGVAIGALLHVSIQVPTLLSLKMLPVIRKDFSLTEVMSVVKTSLPRTMTLSLTTIAMFAIVSIASSLGEGSISRLQFAYNLSAVPVAIIGLSYSVAAFPSLASLFQEGKLDIFASTIANIFRHIIFWSMPVLVLFVVLRAQIVRVILGGGAFTWTDTKLTAAALALFVISIVVNGLFILMTRVFYAAGETRKPLIIASSATVFQIALAYIFTKLYTFSEPARLFLERLFRVEGVPDTGMLMLALTFSIGSFISFFFLFHIVARRYLTRDLVRVIRKTTYDVLFASLLGGVVAYGGLHYFAFAFDLEYLKGVFFQGFLSGVLGIIAMFYTLKVLKNAELEEVSSAIHKKFWKQEVLAPVHHETKEI